MAININADGRRAALSLAVSYDAYQDALSEGRWAGVRVWGGKLLQHHAELGFKDGQLLNRANVQAHIDRADGS